MKRVTNVAVIGAGVMGAGIAQSFSEHGFHVRLFSRSRARIKSALDLIAFRQNELIRSGAITHRAVKKSRQLIEATTSLTKAIEDVHFVSENIPERMRDKQKLLGQLSSLLPDVILSTNTSSLSLNLIAPSVQSPDRLIGMHWMNPAHLMPVVEVIRASRTSDATVHTTCDLARRIDKFPIVLNQDIPGFVVNRLQYALFREAFLLVRKGIVDPASIDEVVKSGLGLRWAISGPFEHMDLSGLNTVRAVAKELFKQLDRSESPPRILEHFLKNGELGLKTGGGFHGLSRASLERLAERRDAALVRLLQCVRTLKGKRRQVRRTARLSS